MTRDQFSLKGLLLLVTACALAFALATRTWLAVLLATAAPLLMLVTMAVAALRAPPKRSSED